MRRVCDEVGLPGQFILTGSAVPPDSHTRHTGAGRVRRVRMRPMTLFESGESTGAVSVRGLFGSEIVSAPAVADEPDMYEIVCRGGWPALQGASGADAQQMLRDYLADLCKTDIEQVDRARRDPVGVARLLESLSRNVATSASRRVLASDMDTVRPADSRTVAAYLSALERLFVLEHLTPWPADLRSRAHITATPKRYLVDPSLAVAGAAGKPRPPDGRPSRLRRTVRSLGGTRPARLCRGQRRSDPLLPRQHRTGGGRHTRTLRRAMDRCRDQARRRPRPRRRGCRTAAAPRESEH